MSCGKKIRVPCILAVSHANFEEIEILGLGAFLFYFQENISKET